MNVSSSGLAQAAMVTSGAQASPTAQAVQVSVLKKALTLEAANAQALLQALPQPPAALPLATEGTLGTQLNVRA